jgi:hypothetical protein
MSGWVADWIRWKRWLSGPNGGLDHLRVRMRPRRRGRQGATGAAGA